MEKKSELYEQVATILDSKKASDIVVLSLKGISTIADEFIIVTGTSSTQIQALADHLEKELKEESVFINHREGSGLGGWILLDFGDVVVHIFNNETRHYYGLERIWSDAKVIDLNFN